MFRRGCGWLAIASPESVVLFADHTARSPDGANLRFQGERAIRSARVNGLGSWSKSAGADTGSYGEARERFWFEVGSTTPIFLKARIFLA